jgi:hypothetical protein
MPICSGTTPQQLLAAGDHLVDVLAKLSTGCGCSTGVTHTTAIGAQRKAVARELLADLRQLDKAVAANLTRCTEAVAGCGTTLTEMVGISDVLTAKIIGHTGDIDRFLSADHYGIVTNYRGTSLSRPAAAQSSPPDYMPIFSEFVSAGRRRIVHWADRPGRKADGSPQAMKRSPGSR